MSERRRSSSGSPRTCSPISSSCIGGRGWIGRIARCWAHDGIDVRSPSPLRLRTLIDMTGRATSTSERLDAAQRLRSIRRGSSEDLDQRDLVDPERLDARLHALRSSGRPGAARLHALLDARGEGPRWSPPSRRSCGRSSSSRGSPAERQHWVSPGGRYRALRVAMARRWSPRSRHSCVADLESGVRHRAQRVDVPRALPLDFCWPDLWWTSGGAIDPPTDCLFLVWHHIPALSRPLPERQYWVRRPGRSLPPRLLAGPI